MNKLIVSLVPVMILSVGLGMSPSMVAAGSPVEVWLTHPAANKWLSQEGTVSFQTAQSTNPLTIKIDESVKYQQIEGFGAALTDSSAWLINQLPATSRNALLEELFDPSTGIGLNLIRVPMGATDVNVGGNYSYDDMPAGQTDPDLANFSVQHDQAYIIPQLQQALSLNPSIKITATAWSPPAWMKTSGSMIGGTLKTGYESTLANYYVKFIQAYGAAGVPIDYVTPQNEPMGTPTWPGMFLSAYREAAVLSAMGSAFAAHNIATEILAWDHNWDVPSYPEVIFNDPAASPYAVGTGWHVYSGSPIYQTLVHNDYPGKKTFITEATGGIWQANNNVALHDSLRTWIIGGTRNYANGVMLWNIALDPFMGPLNRDTNGIPMMHPLVTIDAAKGTATYNVDYYALAHASKFVKPGAYRIYSNTFGEGSIENVAFQNPDGSKVLIAHNAGTSSQTFAVAEGTQLLSYSLPPNAAVTLTWSGPVQSGTIPAAGTVTDPTHDFTFSDSTTITYDPELLPLLNSVRGGTGTLSYSLPRGASIQTGGTALSRTGWIVTASSGGTAAANAIDGNLNTRWSTGHALTEGDWYQVNLGSPKSFSQIVVDTGPDSSFDYIVSYEVYVSNDGVSWGVPLATGCGHIGPVAITLPTDQTAQYIRIVSAGSTSFWWSIGEINVYSASGAGSILAPTAVADGLHLQNWTSADGTVVAAVYNGTASSQSFAVGSYTYTLPKETAAMFIASGLTVPAITAQPLGVDCVAGQTLVLNATASGFGVSYQWKIVGKGAISGATGPMLLISDVSAADAGSYYCTVTNSAGSVDSAAAVVTVAASTSDPARLTNLSIRSQAGTGAQTLIMGFYTNGAKTLLVRGIGPALTPFGVTDVLANPELNVFSGSTIVLSNADWGGAATISSVFAQVGAFPLDPASNDAALVASDLGAGGYTVHITGSGGGTGVALAEVYDTASAFTAATPRLVNLSARTQVGTGDNILIAGFWLSGDKAKTVLIRGIGPTLAQFDVTGVLAAPKLALFSGPNKVIENIGWNGSEVLANAAARVGAFALPPASKDSVLLLTLPPGGYTAHVSGSDGGTGVALVEVYEVP